jgi:hypothetical protein
MPGVLLLFTATLAGAAAPAPPALPSPRGGAQEPRALEGGSVRVKARLLDANVEIVEIEITLSDSLFDVTLGAADPAVLGVVAGNRSPWQCFVRRPRAQAGRPIVAGLYGFAGPGKPVRLAINVPDPGKPSDRSVQTRFEQALIDRFERSLEGPFSAFAAARLRGRNAAPEPGGRAARRRSSQQHADNPAEALGRLMETTTGRVALQEALQHDRGLRRALAGPRTIPVAQIPPPKLAPPPFGELLRALGRQPRLDAEALAKATPADFYYVRFRTLSQLLQLSDIFDTFGSTSALAIQPESAESGLFGRYEAQLGLRRGPLTKLLGDSVVGSLAIVGSDPYVLEGSDMTVLFRVKSQPLFAAALDGALESQGSAHGGLIRGSERISGTTVATASSRDGAVRQRRVSVGDVTIVSNSPGAMERVLATISGHHPALWDEPNFRYFLARDPIDSTGLGFVSERFVAAVTGPAQKIAEARRQVALSELLAPGYASLLYGWLVGRSPASVAELKAARLLSDADLHHSGGETIAFQPGMGAHSSVGTPAVLTPLIDLLPRVDKVSAGERDAYRWFADSYQNRWRALIDPIAVRVDVHGKGLELDLREAPILEGSEYRSTTEMFGHQAIGIGPLGGGVRAAIGVGPRAPLRRELTHGISQGPFQVDIGWIGDWALLGMDDHPSVAEMAYKAWRRDLEPPSSGPVAGGIEDGLGMLSRLPIYAGIGIRNSAAATLFLSLARRMADEVAPGMVTWKPFETINKVPVVRVSVANMPGGPAEGMSLYYSLSPSALLFSLNADTMRRLLEHPQQVVVKTLPSTGKEAQCVIELDPKPGGAFARVLLWAASLEGSTVTGGAQAAEGLLRGAPEVQTPEAADALARAYLGYTPRSGDGERFTLGDDGPATASRGSAHVRKWPTLPVPGSAAEGLIRALGHTRAEFAIDNESSTGAAAPVESLHVHLRLDGPAQ